MDSHSVKIERRRGKRKDLKRRKTKMMTTVGYEMTAGCRRRKQWWRRHQNYKNNTVEHERQWTIREKRNMEREWFFFKILSEKYFSHLTWIWNIRCTNTGWKKKSLHSFHLINQFQIYTLCISTTFFHHCFKSIMQHLMKKKLMVNSLSLSNMLWSFVESIKAVLCAIVKNINIAQKNQEY